MKALTSITDTDRGGRGKMGQWGKIGQMQFFVDNSKAWHPLVKFKPSLSYFAKL